MRIDVQDVDGIGRGFARVRDHFWSVAVLVNNAGLGASHPAEHVTEADWDDMMAVDLRGLLFCCQAAGRIMLGQGERANHQHEFPGRCRGDP